MKTLTLILAVFLLIRCDESGDFTEDHIGIWLLTDDLYIRNADTTSWDFEPTSLDLQEDHDFVRMEGDWEVTGVWRLSLNNLTLRYDSGGSDVYEMLVDGDIMTLTAGYSWYGDQVQYQYVYQREI